MVNFSRNYASWSKNQAMRVGRGERERGAAVVEFALVVPVLMMIVVGMVSSGILYNQQMQLTHAAREGARYGATVGEKAKFTTGTWAENVRKVVVERSTGELTADQVCVALVEGNPAVPVTSGTDHTTAGIGQPCFVDDTSDEDKVRVQVKVSRDGRLDAVFLKMDVKLGAKATAKHESSQ